MILKTPMPYSIEVCTKPSIILAVILSMQMLKRHKAHLYPKNLKKKSKEILKVKYRPSKMSCLRHCS